MALTQRDQYGRIMTPKERFRQQCYSFHGIQPSKNQKDKYSAKAAKEMESKRLATSENPSTELDKLRLMQKSLQSPYLVLDGKAQPAAPGKKQPAPAPSKGKAGSMTPMLGGGMTPLAGDKKVEMMLGIRKEGTASVSSSGQQSTQQKGGAGGKPKGTASSVPPVPKFQQ